jgi:hypothetical protein
MTNQNDPLANILAKNTRTSSLVGHSGQTSTVGDTIYQNELPALSGDLLGNVQDLFSKSTTWAKTDQSEKLSSFLYKNSNL